jgi:GNAT superfamily N-acetyltransferase
MENILFEHHRLTERPELTIHMNKLLADVQATGEITTERSVFLGVERVWMIRKDDDLIGWMVYYPLPSMNRTWIDVLYVDPMYRRMGLGKALLDRVPGALALGTQFTNKTMQSLAMKRGLVPHHLVMANPV